MPRIRNQILPYVCTTMMLVFQIESFVDLSRDNFCIFLFQFYCVLNGNVGYVSQK